MSAWVTGSRGGRAGAAPLAPPADPDHLPLFVVQDADDEPHVFWEGTRKQFGRDDQACQIPVWEQINGRALSKVAGELWCARKQMWVRNLSSAHELVVGGPGGTHLLPARLGTEPGHSCSVPLPSGTVTAPSTGTWTLTVRQFGEPDSDDVTIRVEDIPERHRDAAEALCAPLLAGETAPATYAQIAARKGWTDRVARRRVEDLCAHYQTQIEALPGGRLPDETLTQAVARILVARNKLAVPRGGVERREEAEAP